MGINDDKIERMFVIASQIVDRCTVSQPQFAEGIDLDSDLWPRGLVAVRITGQLRGRTFAALWPITIEMYREESYRPMLIARARETWRQLARSELVPLVAIVGPKGKLPA